MNEKMMKETKKMSSWLIVGLVLLVCVLITPVMAQERQIDILASDAHYHCMDNANISAGTGAAGTGRFDPFLTTFTPKGTKVFQEGINSLESLKQDETFFGGARTHSIQLKEVPQFTIDGTLYRKFNLDADEAGNINERWLSIGIMRVFVGPNNDAGNYNPNTGAFGSGTTTPGLVWDLDTQCKDAFGEDSTNSSYTEAFVALDYRLEEGSGWSDLSVFIPESAFTGKSQDDWVYLYTRFADPEYFNTMPPGAPAGANLRTNDGFEEWGVETGQPVILPPALKLVKTVANNFDGEAEPVDWNLCADDTLLSFCELGNADDFYIVAADVPYLLSEDPNPGEGYESDGWSCDGGTLVNDQITLANNDVVTCTIHNHDFGTPVPEFPSLALQVGLVIGFLGAVLFIRQSKEN